MSNYRNSMRDDVSKAYNKSANGGAKKPNPKKMKSSGKKIATSSGAAVGGGS